MAYSTSNPPVAISQPLTRAGSTVSLTDNKPSLFFYSSTNLTTDMTAANFFSNARDLGMREGDMVQGVQYTSAGSSRITFLGSIGAVSTAGAALSTGSVMTSTFS